MCVGARARVGVCVWMWHSGGGNLRRCNLRDTRFGFLLGTEGCWSVRISVFSTWSPPVRHWTAAALSQVHSAVLVLILKKKLDFYSSVGQDHSVLYHLHSVAPISPWKINFLTLCAQTKLQGRAKLEGGEERGKREGRVGSLRSVGPSHFPEMLQPIPKLWANGAGSFTPSTIGKEREAQSNRYIFRQR